MNAEQLNTIEEMAYRCFTPDMIAINLEMNEFEFLELIETPNSEVRKAFYKGVIRLQTELREDVIKAAKNGSNPAIEQLTKLMKELQSWLT